MYHLKGMGGYNLLRKLSKVILATANEPCSYLVWLGERWVSPSAEDENTSANNLITVISFITLKSDLKASCRCANLCWNGNLDSCLHSYLNTRRCEFFPPDRISLCNSFGCPGTQVIDQAGLELTEIRLPLPPSTGITSVRGHVWL